MKPTLSIEKIKSKKLTLGVIGLGYVGLPLAMLFAQKGYRVIGFLRDTKKLADFLHKKYHVDGIDTNLADRLRKTGYLKVAHIDARELNSPDVFFICVPTPIHTDKTPDLSAINSVAQHLREMDLSGKLIINESTVAPGTTRKIFGKLAGDYLLACSPERVDSGNKEKTVGNIPKVVGGRDKESLVLAKTLYESVISAPVVAVTSLEVAEMAKMLENTYRAVNIALVNEFALLSEKMGVDILEVINAAKTKWSFQAHYPSLGVGGHCIPVDPWYLVDYAQKKGIELTLVRQGLEGNEEMTRHVASKIIKVYQPRMKVLLYGLTYKKDIKDLRESPAVRLALFLKQQKIPFQVYDPLLVSSEIKKLGLAIGKLTPVDLFIVGTDHSSLASDWKKAITAQTIVVDGRNFFKRRVGKVVYGVGRTLA